MRRKKRNKTAEETMKSLSWVSTRFPVLFASISPSQKVFSEMQNERRETKSFELLKSLSFSYFFKVLWLFNYVISQEERERKKSFSSFSSPDFSQEKVDAS